jgi:hypothetical protein
MHRDWSSGYPGRLETQRTRAVVRTKRNCGTRPDLNFRFACDPLTRQFDLLAFATRERAQRLTQGQVIEGRVAHGLNETFFRLFSRTPRISTYSWGMKLPGGCFSIVLSHR